MNRPSLPVLNRPLDNTALATYMQCPREYYMSMHLHRRAVGAPSVGIAYGGLMHKILEFYYRGFPPALVEIMASKWWETHKHDVVGDYRTLDRGLLDFKRYRDKWGQTPEDEQGQTIGGGTATPAVELQGQAMGGRLLLPWTYKIDRIIELGSLDLIEDHKYTARLDGNFVQSFSTSNQMKGYVRSAQYLFPKRRINGVRINLIHALKEKTNFERHIVTYTREELDEWETNVNQWAARLAGEQFPSLDELREGALWPAGNYGDAASGKGCMRKFGLCGYHSLCSIGPEFRVEKLAEIPENPWNPLEVEDD